MRLAEHHYGKAYETLKADPAQDWHLYGAAGYRYACLLAGRGDMEGATALLSSILEQTQGVAAFPDAERSALLTQMALCQIELKQYDAAKLSLGKAYEQCVKSAGGEGKGTFNLVTTGDCGVVSFLEMGDCGEAERWLRRSDAELAAYSQHGDPAMVEEYRGLHAIFHARLLLATGHAAQAAALYDAIPRQRLLTPLGSDYAAQYLMDAGRYDEAAAMYTYYDTAFSSLKPSHITFDIISQHLKPRYTALRRAAAGRRAGNAGGSEQALAVADTIAAAIDSALLWQKQSDAAELAVIYQTHEQELALEEQKFQTSLFRILTAAALLLLILVGGFLARLHRYNLLLTEKNRRLYRQIKEREQAGDEERKKMEQHATETLTQNQQLYKRLCLIMEDPAVYTDPDANHETLARLLGTNRTYLGEALRECADTTPADFINRYRIRRAAQLLATTDDPVSLVAEESGIPNRSTFSRLFRDRYSMTPTEFRKAAK